jgi:hypothetical protein
MKRPKPTMLKKVLLAVGVASLVLPRLASAEVSYTPPSGNVGPIILVHGQISPEDLKDFLAFARLAREDDSSAGYDSGSGGLYFVRLDSIGGDVQTALAMGRILRRDRAVAVVLDDSKCFSSCVFVLAGAKSRSVYGAVGIHRPYARMDDATTVTAQKQQYERLGKEVKAFLQDVNIPQELYDHMIRIPPETVKVLSPDDLQRYGLNEDDPYETAAGVARTAQANGISTEELIRRMAKARAECICSESDCITRILKQGR